MRYALLYIYMILSLVSIGHKFKNKVSFENVKRIRYFNKSFIFNFFEVIRMIIKVYLKISLN